MGKKWNDFNIRFFFEEKKGEKGDNDKLKKDDKKLRAKFFFWRYSKISYRYIVKKMKEKGKTCIIYMYLPNVL